MSMTVKQMAEKTQDAYSFDAYGESGWAGAVRELRRRGMDDRQAEAVLRSKHTRWAGDMDEKRRYGSYNGQTMREYLDRCPITEHQLETLVAGTFND